MNYLLDTCALLWLVNGDARLPPRARQAIADPQATIFLSALAAAEVAIEAGK